MSNTVQQLQKLGQSVWFDDIRRGLIKSGDLQELIDLGVTGLTSNPSIFEKAVSGSTDYDDSLLALAERDLDATRIYEELTIEDIQGAADLLRPVYDRTGGDDGYASLEVNPHLAHDTQTTISEARRLFAALDRPNVMIKVPGTPEGAPAVRSLIGHGINVNVTLLFSLEAYDLAREAYLSGLEDLAASGGEVGAVASVASFFVSRVDTAVDAQLDERIASGSAKLQALMGRAAVANAKLAYRDFKDTFNGARFAQLKAKGARVQRTLWGSTSAKNPSYSDVMYVDSLIGADTVNTMPEPTLRAFLDHGVASKTLETDLDQAATLSRELDAAGISMERVTAKLLTDGVKAFADSYDELLTNIERKRTALLARQRQDPSATPADS
jgi:transaldolase